MVGVTSSPSNLHTAQRKAEANSSAAGERTALLPPAGQHWRKDTAARSHERARRLYPAHEEEDRGRCRHEPERGSKQWREVIVVFRSDENREGASEGPAGERCRIRPVCESRSFLRIKVSAQADVQPAGFPLDASRRLFPLALALYFQQRKIPRKKAPGRDDRMMPLPEVFDQAPGSEAS